MHLIRPKRNDLSFFLVIDCIDLDLIKQIPNGNGYKIKYKYYSPIEVTLSQI